MAVSGKYDLADLAPLLVLRSWRIAERWFLQPVFTRKGRACNRDT